jgi:hypothetical protein
MILRVVLNAHESPLRAALVGVLLDALAALSGRTPRRVRRLLARSGGVLTIAIEA